MSKVEDAKKLHVKRLELHNEIKTLADNQEEWNAEDRQKWDEVNTAYDENKVELDKANAELKAEAEEKNKVSDRLEAIDKLTVEDPEAIYKLAGRDGASLSDNANRVANGDTVDQQGPTNEQRGMAMAAWLGHDSPYFNTTQDHYTAAQVCGIDPRQRGIAINLDSRFDEIRSALLPARHGFKNALSGQTGSAGGFTFGETFVRNLESAMLAFGGMMQVAEVIRTSSGEPLRWPTATDTSNTGRQLGESQAVTETEPTFGQVIWNAYKFSSDEIKVPSELLRDSVFNLPQVLSRMLGERLGRIQNTRYTTGSGAGTAKGIVTAAAAGVTAASATAITFDEVIDLEHSLDPSRRTLPGVGYMFNDAILQALRKLKDGNSNYLWQTGANSGAPDTLNTKPYQINQDMQSTIAASTVTMLFGELSAYKIRQVGVVRLFRLVERHRENDQDAFLAFVEGDGNLLDAGDGPVKKLTQAAA